EDDGFRDPADFSTKHVLEGDVETDGKPGFQIFHFLLVIHSWVACGENPVSLSLDGHCPRWNSRRRHVARWRRRFAAAAKKHRRARNREVLRLKAQGVPTTAPAARLTDIGHGCSGQRGCGEGEQYGRFPHG